MQLRRVETNQVIEPGVDRGGNGIIIAENESVIVIKWPGSSYWACLLYTSPSPRDRTRSRMPSSA